jgi:hypothetical protein
MDNSAMRDINQGFDQWLIADHKINPSNAFGVIPDPL